ncbi:hypothetical protein ACFYY1_30370 [Streptomyces sp. NPDC001890]
MTERGLDYARFEELFQAAAKRYGPRERPSHQRDPGLTGHG